MILGWGLAGGQGALLTELGNSIPPRPSAEVFSLSREPLLSGARYPHPPGLGLNLTLLRTSRPRDTQLQPSSPRKARLEVTCHSGALSCAHYLTGTLSTYDPVLPVIQS